MRALRSVGPGLLIAGTLLRRVTAVDALRDVGRLLRDGHHHAARIRVEAHVRAREADLADRGARDLVVVELGLRRDLAEQEDEPGLRGGLARDATVRIFCEAGVEHGI